MLFRRAPPKPRYIQTDLASVMLTFPSERLLVSRLYPVSHTTSHNHPETNVKLVYTKDNCLLMAGLSPVS